MRRPIVDRPEAVDQPDLRLRCFIKEIGCFVTKFISISLKVIWVLSQPATSLLARTKAFRPYSKLNF